MAFSTSEILEEFSLTTSNYHGMDSWQYVCELARARRLFGCRKRYQRWIGRGDNLSKKRKYMKAYDQLAERKAKKNADSRRRRAAVVKKPRPRKVVKYKLNGKRVESSATRHERYLRAKASGYLKGKSP